MTRTELIIQLLKIAIGLAFGAYFVWWSLEVLGRLTPEYDEPAAMIGPRIMKFTTVPVESLWLWTLALHQNRARLRWRRSPRAGGGNRPTLPLARPLSFSSRPEATRGANLNRCLVFEVGAGRIRTSHAAAPVTAEGRVTDGRTRSTPPGVKVTPAT